MNHGSRGAVLVETAMSVGFALLAVLTMLQLALITYSQLSADGSAFLGARSVAESAQSSLAADTAFAQKMIARVFPAIGTATVNVPVGPTSGGSGSDGTVNVSVVQGLSVMLAAIGEQPGPAQSHAIERVGAATPGIPATYPYSAALQLTNYYSASGLPNSSYAVGIAQTVKASGNGVNGPYAEWYCRAGVYASLWRGATSYPGASKGGSGSAYDPANANSAQHQVYQWDAGATCS